MSSKRAILSNFLARDVYMRWRKLACKANASIDFFTPFFDDTIIRLIDCGNLPSSSISVITDFDPETLLRLHNQLKSAKKLLARGISLSHLPGLHAKILLVDEEFAFVGSQNFTRRGRKNKEVSCGAIGSVSDRIFLKTLEDWKSLATPIDQLFVDELLTRVQPLVKGIREIESTTSGDILSCHEKLSSRREAERQRRIREESEKDRRRLQAYRQRRDLLKAKSRLQLASGDAHAVIRTVHPSRWDFYGSSTYRTLSADGYDLTRWVAKNTEDKNEHSRLRRFGLYPILVIGTNKMAFVRIAKTRITYVRYQVVYNDRTLDLGDEKYNVAVDFDTEDSTFSNVSITVSKKGGASCAIRLNFTGDQLSLVDRTFSTDNAASPRERRGFRVNLERNLFRAPDPETKLLRFLEGGWRFTTIGISNKNATELFQSTRYTLNVVDYRSVPFLLATPED